MLEAASPTTQDLGQRKPKHRKYPYKSRPGQKEKHGKDAKTSPTCTEATGIEDELDVLHENCFT